MRPITSRQNWSWAALTAAALTLAACTPEQELETPVTCSQELQLCQVNVFLEVEEFEFLRQNGAVILDARSGDDYLNGHIPGAIHGSWRAFVDPDRNGILWDDESLLEDAARDLGLNGDEVVAIYGPGGTRDSAAGRLFWTLEYLGHENVYLLNGGFDAWTAAGYDGLTAGEFTPERGTFELNIRDDIRATFDEVEAAIYDETLRLVDTRTIEEWEGDEDALRGNPWGGHIPEAIHYHWEDAIGEDGLLRDREEIRAELEALGIVPGTLAIPYCQSGVRSGYFYAILSWLDFPEVKNYDGSWWEWSRVMEDPNGEPTPLPGETE